MYTLSTWTFLPFLLERFDKLLFFTELFQKTGHAFTKAVSSHLWEQYLNNDIHRVVLVYHFVAFFHLSLIAASVICSGWKNRQGLVHPDL